MSNELCAQGCGRPGLFANQKTGVLRCSKNISGCPASQAKKLIKLEKTMEIRRAKQEAERGPQICQCGQPAVHWNKRDKKWKCFSGAGNKCPKDRADLDARNEANHGTTKVAHFAGVQAKRIEFLKEHHASMTPEQKAAINKKREDTLEQRFGFRNIGQCPENRENIIKTNLENHGVEHTLQVQAFRDKGKETMRAKWGETHQSRVPEIIAKIKNTNLIRYGFENPMQR